jgi:hypothetical protein
MTQQTLAVLQDLRADQRAFRSDVMGALERMNQQLVTVTDSLRGDLRHDMDAGFAETRRVHDRDFRIAIAVSLAIAVGLAGLIARAVHWL